MMEKHSIIDGKVHLYKRERSRLATDIAPLKYEHEINRVFSTGSVWLAYQP